MSTIPFNPLDPQYQMDPYPHYRVLREHSAIWVEELDAWFVGRYLDVLDMVRRPETFSNRRFVEISKGEFDYAPGAAQLVGTDPPEHTRLRKLAAAGFKPSRIRALEARIESITGDYLNALASRAAFDFQQEFADRIPIHIIADMLGVPPAHGERFKEWTSHILSAANRHRMDEADKAQIRRSVDEAREYFGRVIEERRLEPGDDVISAFLTAQEEGDALSTEEILGLAILLLIGGDETTAHLLGNTLVALWDHPDQLELVQQERDLIPDLIEESLRYEAPVQTVFLTTTEAVAIGDVEIPAEAAVIGVWGAANRDETEFPAPDRFDVTRRSSSHLAFGHGPHYCLGATLARVEARIILNSILDQLPALRRSGCGPVDWIPSFWIRGPRTLPVTA